MAFWGRAKLGGKALLLLLALAASAARGADTHCQSNPDDCVAIGQWQVSLGVGLGGRTNPLLGGDDIPILLLPQFSYYGERFFWDTTTAGYALHESAHQSLALVGTLGLEQMYFNDVSLGNFVIDGGGRLSLNNTSGGVSHINSVRPPEDTTNTPNTTDKDGPSEFFHKRDSDAAGATVAVTTDNLSPRRMAVLAGMEYSVYLGNTSVSVQWLHDVIGVHQGQEVRLGLDRRFRYQQNQFTLAGGAVWQSAKVIDYYYGLDLGELEQSPELAYRAGDSTTPYVRLGWRRPISQGWTLQATVHHKWLGSAVTASPLVAQDSSTTVFVGGVYHF
jgi:outer membrane protein